MLLNYYSIIIYFIIILLLLDEKKAIHFAPISLYAIKRVCGLLTTGELTGSAAWTYQLSVN